jgi:hypothetical protein
MKWKGLEQASARTDMGDISGVAMISQYGLGIHSFMDSLPESIILSSKDLPYISGPPKTLLERADAIVDRAQARCRERNDASNAVILHVEFLNDAKNASASQNQDNVPDQNLGVVINWLA